MRLLLIPLAIALAIRPGPLASQQLPALRPGTRVRISSIAAGLQRQQGTVLGERGDTLDFRPNSCESACAVLKIPGEAVDRVEVFGGRSHVKGALVGGFVGGLFGAAVASSTTDRHANCESGNSSAESWNSTSDSESPGYCVRMSCESAIATFLAGVKRSSP